MSQVVINIVIVINIEIVSFWIKDFQIQQWRLGEFLELRRVMMVIYGNDSGLLGGVVVGIIVGVIVVLVVVIILVIYGICKYKKREYQVLEEERQSLVLGIVEIRDMFD